MVAGEEFKIIVRRVSTRRLTDRVSDSQVTGRNATNGNRSTMRNWRYVVGTFQVTVPVSTPEHLLLPEENTLAIMKWRLGRTAVSDRWYPVLQRYIADLTAKVNGLGGKAGSITPSPTGIPPILHPSPIKENHEFTGKITCLTYDRFGDFEGFCLLTEHGHEHRFTSREYAIEDVIRRAWLERDVVTVIVHAHMPLVPVSILLRRSSRRAED